MSSYPSLVFILGKSLLSKDARKYQENIEEYYSSTAPPGDSRLMDMLEESAFFSRALMSASADYRTAMRRS